MRTTFRALVAEPLALGRVFIQYRTENLRVVPAFGERVHKVSPRIGHIHITVDNAPWHKQTCRESSPRDRGNRPHGIWPSGDESRVYVASENGGTAAAIDTLTNKVIADIPIGQTTQALVYIPNAAPDDSGTENLTPLGEAGNSARLHLAAAGSAFPNAQASVAVNSLGRYRSAQFPSAAYKSIAISPSG